MTSLFVGLLKSIEVYCYLNSWTNSRPAAQALIAASSLEPRFLERGLGSSGRQRRQQLELLKPFWGPTTLGISGDSHRFSSFGGVELGKTHLPNLLPVLVRSKSVTMETVRWVIKGDKRKHMTCLFLKGFAQMTWMRWTLQLSLRKSFLACSEADMPGRKKLYPNIGSCAFIVKNRTTWSFTVNLCQSAPDAKKGMLSPFRRPSNLLSI